MPGARLHQPFPNIYQAIFRQCIVVAQWIPVSKIARTRLPFVAGIFAAQLLGAGIGMVAGRSDEGSVVATAAGRHGRQRIAALDDGLSGFVQQWKFRVEFVRQRVSTHQEPCAKQHELQIRQRSHPQVQSGVHHFTPSCVPTESSPRTRSRLPHLTGSPG